MDVRRTFVPSFGGPATIELGDMSEPPPVRSADPISCGTQRRLWGAVLVLLVLFGAAPSNRAVAYLGRPLWTVPSSLGGFAVSDGGVVMSEPGGRRIIGRDLATGEIRWQIPLDTPPQYIVELTDGTAAVVVRDRSADAGEVIETTVSLIITAGGSILARVPGEVLPLVFGQYLVIPSEPGSVTVNCPADRDRCTDVSTFDTATGRTAWRVPVGGAVVASAADPDTGVARLAMIDRSGLIELRDPATGTVIAAVTPPAGWPATASAVRPQALIVGQTLIAAVRLAEVAVVAAYPIGPGEPSWTTTIAVDSRPEASTSRFYLASCGRLVCLHADGQDNGFVVRTGERVVQVPHQLIGQVGELLVGVPSTEVSGTVRERRTVFIFGPTAPIQVLPDTAVVSRHGASDSLLLAHQGATSTDFTVLDGAGAARLLGSVPGADLTCSATRDRLACADPGGELRVWRLP